jgi:hypothetical protein
MLRNATEDRKIALGVARQVFISLLNNLFDDLSLRLGIHFLLSSLLVFLLVLNDDFPPYFLFNCGHHLGYLLSFLPRVVFVAIQTQLAQFFEEGC